MTKTPLPSPVPTVTYRTDWSRLSVSGTHLNQTHTLSTSTTRKLEEYYICTYTLSSMSIWLQHICNKYIHHKTRKLIRNANAQYSTGCLLLMLFACLAFSDSRNQTAGVWNGFDPGESRSGMVAGGRDASELLLLSLRAYITSIVTSACRNGRKCHGSRMWWQTQSCISRPFPACFAMTNDWLRTISKAIRIKYQPFQGSAKFKF